MSNTPFMPFWASDFLGDTLDLDTQEIGAYLLLILAQWNRGGESLPNDQKKLKLIARCGRAWPRVWRSIEGYFEVDEDGIFSPKTRYVYASVVAKREVNKHNGALGGAAKALKSKEQGLANATNSLERKATIPKPKPNNKKEYCPFSEFWEKWPNKVSKAAAEKAWGKLCDADRKAVIVKIDEWFRSWRAANPSASPIHAASFLNGRRWEDQIQSSLQSGGQSEMDRWKKMANQ